MSRWENKQSCPNCFWSAGSHIKIKGAKIWTKEAGRRIITISQGLRCEVWSSVLVCDPMELCTTNTPDKHNATAVTIHHWAQRKWKLRQFDLFLYAFTAVNSRGYMALVGPRSMGNYFAIWNPIFLRLRFSSPRGWAVFIFLSGRETYDPVTPWCSSQTLCCHSKWPSRCSEALR